MKKFTTAPTASTLPTIHIQQPRVPKYREDFFERLSMQKGFKLRVYHSPAGRWVIGSESSSRWKATVGQIKSLPFGFFWQVGLGSIVLRHADILVISGNPRYLSSLFVLVKAKLLGIKVIWWGHLRSSTSSKLGMAVREFLMQFVDGLVFYTDDEAERFKLKYAGTKKYTAIPVASLNNGINTDPIQNLRAEYKFEERKANILFLGRLTEKSQFDILIEAISRRSQGNQSLHVIGDGPKAAVYREYASELGVCSSIVWHGNISNEAEISAIVNKCCAFIYPGAVGLSLIHAMAYGVPVIINDNLHHQMPEVNAFQLEVNGITFQEGSSRDLANVLDRCSGEARLLERLSSGALAVTRRSYNTRDMSERFGRFVKYFLGGSDD